MVDKKKISKNEHMRLIFIIPFFICFSVMGFAQESNNINTELRLRFASKEEAQAFLTSDVDYTNRWNDFDVKSRLQNPDGTKSELMTLIKESVREWSDDEIAKLSRVFKSIQDSCARHQYVFPVPREIVMVKTTGQEESGAGGYTRQNHIIFSEKMLTASDEALQNLMAHELFHVLTRNDIDFKRRIYSVIGFTVMDREIEFPEDFRKKMISNPDISKNDSYATFTPDGEEVNFTMVLYTDRDYMGGNLFSYLRFGFVPLDEELKPVLKMRQVDVLGMDKIGYHFFQKVGRNTSYIIHPEEILADNFAFALLGKQDLPNQEIVEHIRNILKKKKE